MHQTSRSYIEDLILKSMTKLFVLAVLNWMQCALVAWIWFLILKMLQQNIPFIPVTAWAKISSLFIIYTVHLLSEYYSSCMNCLSQSQENHLRLASWTYICVNRATNFFLRSVLDVWKNPSAWHRNNTFKFHDQTEGKKKAEDISRS